MISLRDIENIRGAMRHDVGSSTASQAVVDDASLTSTTDRFS